MNEKKIKIAFQRVKEDMLFLKNEIDQLKQTPSVKLDKELKKVEKISTNFENEIKNINIAFKEINDTIKKEQEFRKKIQEQIKENKENIKLIDKKLAKAINKEANEELDIKLIDKKLEEFAQMIDEKISLEIANLKLMSQEENLKLLNEIEKIKKNNKNINSKDQEEKIKNTFEEFAQMIDEKISLEINSIKMEYTEEIAKLYDKLFNEMIEFKHEIEKIKKDKNKSAKKTTNDNNKSSNKTTKKTNKKKNEIKETNEELLYESEFEKKEKEGKLKKIAKWLFVDEEEEEEFDSIKKQIKKE